MSIQGEIDRIRSNMSDSYAAVESKGGTVPETQSSDNLARAINSIPTEIKDATFLVNAPIGTIVIWSGAAENIPSGWALCDGQDGRPDLRDKFVLGAGGTYPVGETGGEAEVALTVEQMPNHRHGENALAKTTDSDWGIAPWGYSVTGGGGKVASSPIAGLSTNARVTTQVHTDYSGDDQSHNNMPPYYALCYIMKVSLDETDAGVVPSGGTTSQLLAKKSDVDYDLEWVDKPGEVYSTEETRIGTWIDGKPLYRKVVSLLVDFSLSTVSFLVSLPDGANPVFWKGFVGETPWGAHYPIPYVEGDMSLFSVLSNGKLYVIQKWNGVNNDIPCVMSVEYTKNTD